MDSLIEKGNISEYSSDAFKENIVFFEHPTIADDCIEALKNLGYNVIKYSWSKESIMKLLNEKPDYIFTINFNSSISEISQLLSIPYISWTVDTPNYFLYSKSISNPISFSFIYDKKIAEQLKSCGIKNVYYAPVAANVKRLDKMKIEKADIEKYSSQISFVGNVTISEYSKFMKGKLSS